MKNAIICDLDGTLCLLGDRKPYGKDIDVSKDEVNEPVSWLLHVMQDAGYKIIFVSGREDLHEKATVEWLNRHIDFNYELWMRKTGDYRKDAVIKREIFDNHIKDKYKILFTLDDRNQVVDMWRKELNLPCFQVDYGDF